MCPCLMLNNRAYGFPLGLDLLYHDLIGLLNAFWVELRQLFGLAITTIMPLRTNGWSGFGDGTGMMLIVVFDSALSSSLCERLYVL